MRCTDAASPLRRDFAHPPRQAMLEPTESNSLPPAAPAAPADYWCESMRPLVSLAFVAPMLVLYELGVVVLGPQAVRNGADVWLRRLLDAFGFGQYFLLPLLTCGILLAWHHTTRHSWRLPSAVFGGMSLESLTFALLLLALAQLQGAICGAAGVAIPCGTGETAGVARTIAGMVGYLGAGIYEELLFRLTLLPAAIGLLRLVGLPRAASLVCGVLLTSVLFSLAHYRLDFSFAQVHLVTAHGYAFDWFSFVFRFFAGAFFSLLFVYRGFGIAAGSHALYDILAVIV